MKTYIVTGGAGFIGAHIAHALLLEGHRVLIFDDLSTGKISNIPKGADLVKIDLGKIKNYQKIRKVKADAVFHLAGQSSGEISFKNPWADLQSHVASTFHLLQFCKEKSIQRFLYASSMAVYGNPISVPVRETDAIMPKSYYGAAKASAENYIRLYSDLGLQTTILRLFSIYGPGQNLKNMSQGMVSIYLAYMCENKPILIKGSVDRFRDFVYIDDLVRAWIMASDNSKAFGKTYNICSGKKTTVERLISQLTNIYKKSNYPTICRQATPGDQFGVIGDPTSIKKDLGWKAIVPLGKGLSETVREATGEGRMFSRGQTKVPLNTKNKNW
jgi:UDP-glucose 4-epimerase